MSSKSKKEKKYDPSSPRKESSLESHLQFINSDSERLDRNKSLKIPNANSENKGSTTKEFFNSSTNNITVQPLSSLESKITTVKSSNTKTPDIYSTNSLSPLETVYNKPSFTKGPIDNYTSSLEKNSSIDSLKQTLTSISPELESKSDLSLPVSDSGLFPISKLNYTGNRNSDSVNKKTTLKDLPLISNPNDSKKIDSTNQYTDENNNILSEFKEQIESSSLRTETLKSIRLNSVYRPNKTENGTHVSQDKKSNLDKAFEDLHRKNSNDILKGSSFDGESFSVSSINLVPLDSKSSLEQTGSKKESGNIISNGLLSKTYPKNTQGSLSDIDSNINNELEKLYRSSIAHEANLNDFRIENDGIFPEIDFSKKTKSLNLHGQKQGSKDTRKISRSPEKKETQMAKRFSTDIISEQNGKGSMQSSSIKNKNDFEIDVMYERIMSTAASEGLEGLNETKEKKKIQNRRSAHDIDCLKTRVYPEKKSGRVKSASFLSLARFGPDSRQNNSIFEVVSKTARSKSNEMDFGSKFFEKQDEKQDEKKGRKKLSSIYKLGNLVFSTNSKNKYTYHDKKEKENETFFSSEADLNNINDLSISEDALCEIKSFLSSNYDSDDNVSTYTKYTGKKSFSGSYLEPDCSHDTKTNRKIASKLNKSDYELQNILDKAYKNIQSFSKMIENLSTETTSIEKWTELRLFEHRYNCEYVLDDFKSQKTSKTCLEDKESLASSDNSWKRRSRSFLTSDSRLKSTANSTFQRYEDLSAALRIPVEYQSVDRIIQFTNLQPNGLSVENSPKYNSVDIYSPLKYSSIYLYDTPKSSSADLYGSLKLRKRSSLTDKDKINSIQESLSSFDKKIQNMLDKDTDDEFSKSGKGTNMNNEKKTIKNDYLVRKHHTENKFDYINSSPHIFVTSFSSKYNGREDSPLFKNIASSTFPKNNEPIVGTGNKAEEKNYAKELQTFFVCNQCALKDAQNITNGPKQIKNSPILPKIEFSYLTSYNLNKDLDIMYPRLKELVESKINIADALKKHLMRGRGLLDYEKYLSKLYSAERQRIVSVHGFQVNKNRISANFSLPRQVNVVKLNNSQINKLTKMGYLSGEGGIDKTRRKNEKPHSKSFYSPGRSRK
ncbi:hypothetical protein BB560_001098 [Smittium megazygosporum]|uniref:Uncharacterized protein n=1 Tax=Smittium megazygosporum TaxID=133381 RepID=A0A2T9ZIG4_9FUNG|nr:hypothetical protein BB560_001098 [Smittium megazygosporum]